jgi:hypothetical protein
MAYLADQGGAYNPYKPQVGPYNVRGAGRTPGNNVPAVGLFKSPTSAPPPFNPQVAQFPKSSASSGGANPYDISSDPMVQDVRGFNVKENNQYGANATDSYRKTLLAFGSRELARSMFGDDQSFMDAVGNAPFSRMANIRNQYEGRGGLINQANERLNNPNQNLFFSSERTANVLPELMRQRLGQEYQGNIDAQDAMSQIGRTLYEQQNAGVMREIQAMQDARDRATAAALQSGYGPGSADVATSGVTAPDFFANLSNVAAPGQPGSPFAQPNQGSMYNTPSSISWKGY